jgi:DNA-binding transcriptional LysR family regulator
MTFDPALLPTFLAVLDSGRISAAARVLRLSQPAVTAQIRKLEEAMGAPLFVRSARGVVPTPAGERLAGYARSNSVSTRSAAV